MPKLVATNINNDRLHFSYWDKLKRLIYLCYINNTVSVGLAKKIIKYNALVYEANCFNITMSPVFIQQFLKQSIILNNSGKQLFEYNFIFIYKILYF